MAKTVAPLLSFDARGAIAKAQVYSNWRGIQYARRWVTPANPKSTAQTQVRDTFKWLNTVWSFLPALAIAGWDGFAAGQPLTGRNAWIKTNLSPLINAADLTDFTFSPSSKSGPIAQAIVITPGVGSLSVALTAPSLPTGWTITKAIAAAIADQDPQTGTLYEVTAASDDTAPYAVDLTGLTTAQLYRVGGWFEYAKPDGTVAYGRSLMDSGTPT